MGQPAASGIVVHSERRRLASGEIVMTFSAATGDWAEDINILDRLQRAVEEETDTASVTFECRRNEKAAADIVLRVPGLSPASGGAISDRLASWPEVEAARCSPGKLAVRLTDDAVAHLGRMILAGSGLTLIDPRFVNRAILVDFCDPNATKALHVGHLRNVALGNAIAALMSAVGGDVTKQSIVCDIGRNVCEAMAGYRQFKFDMYPADANLKSDRFVGECYAEYVKASSDESEADAIDAPIAREVTVRSDLAQQLTERWQAGDPEVLAMWRRIRAWAIDGQRQTLGRLRLAFDRVLYESDAFPIIESLMGSAASEMVFRRSESGAVVFDSGRDEFRILPLVRPDGFPTEHMRALALWWGLRQKDVSSIRCIHIMGDEWVPATVLREEILTRLGCFPFEAYIKVPCGMVLMSGSTMKSSTGEALLIDDVLDRVARTTQLSIDTCAGIEIDTIARVIAMGYFLSREMARPIEFSWDAFLDERSNPGWCIASAWARAESEMDSTEPPNMRDPAWRLAIIQAQLLPQIVRLSARSLDPLPLARYVFHFAQWSRTIERSPGVSCIVSRVLTRALTALGLTAAQDSVRHVHGASTSPLQSQRERGGTWSSH
jgi:arginyl-tRNA synthetase